MNTYADKTQENKSQSAANAVSQKQSDSGSTFQFVDNRPEAVAQRKLQAIVNNHSSQQQNLIQKKENNTGLPDNLKTGIESLSAYSMDDVKVHYNSDKPAQLQAHAYAQGTDIHLSPGQEKHLPHEAWHVVQQNQGRVTPTMQMKGKVNVNDDIGLEREADVMGAKAMSVQFASKNPVKTHKINSSVVQKYEAKPIDKYEIEGLKKNKTVIYLGWDDESIDRLLTWSKSMKQFRSTIFNIKKSAWELLEEVESTEFANKVLKTKTDKKGESVKDVVSYAKVMQELPDGFLKMTHILQENKGDDFIKKIGEKKGIIETAYGIGSTNAKDILKAQYDLQKWMASILSKDQIMTGQRSVGFEFEFARYESVDEEEKASHTILGESASFTSVFGLPFVLETDSGKELEIGFPPLLVGMLKSGPDKTATKKLWDVTRGAMGSLRDKNIGKTVNILPLSTLGIGSDWTMKPIAASLTMVDGRPGKASSAKDQVYSQMNITLTAKESAQLMVSKTIEMYQSNKEEYFAKAYSKVMELLGEFNSGRLKVASIQTAKGLSSLMAIPSINMFAQDLFIWGSMSDVSSTVKEVFGVWIKDSIPNIVDNSLNVKEDRKVFNLKMKKIKGALESDLSAFMTEYIDKFLSMDLSYDNGLDDVLVREKKLASFQNIFDTELQLTLNTLINRLSKPAPTVTKNRGGSFGNESFPTRGHYERRGKGGKHGKGRKRKVKAKGEGVRKETFVNIPQGKEEHLHLTEIRNEHFMDEYLKE